MIGVAGGRAAYRAAPQAAWKSLSPVKRVQLGRATLVSCWLTAALIWGTRRVRRIPIPPAKPM